MEKLRLPLDEDRQIGLGALRAELEAAGVKVDGLDTVNDDGEHLELEVRFKGKAPPAKKVADVVAAHEATILRDADEARALLLRVAAGEEGFGRDPKTDAAIVRALALVWAVTQPEWGELL